MELVVAEIIFFLLCVGWFLVLFLKKRVVEKEWLLVRKKYYGWFPIAAILYAIIFFPKNISLLIFTLLTAYGYIQLLTKLQIKKMTKENSTVIPFFVFLIICPCVFYLFNFSKNILILVLLGVVLADVSAYFFAKLAKNKHSLPLFINPNKTYEGICGAFIGSYIGLLLLIIVNIIPFGGYSIFQAFIIGVGANIGDLINSMLKRANNIEEWGNVLPGHGGIFDRFASIYVALALIAFLNYIY